jgi:hypothetical protein
MYECTDDLRNYEPVHIVGSSASVRVEEESGKTLWTVAWTGKYIVCSIKRLASGFYNP